MEERIGVNYTEIFKEIVSIMSTDSASYPDFGAGKFEEYEKKITDDMDRTKFFHLVQDYIASFGIQGHLSFVDNTCGYVGFNVMRMGDNLYVTKANSETALKPGDKITAIDLLPVKEIARREKNMLMGETNERQGGLWPSILKYYKTLTVEHEDGSSEEIDIKLDTKEDPEDKYYCKKYGDDTLFIRLSDFVDAGAIGKLYEDNSKDLEHCRNLIVDVRGNGGGADTCFVPLLEYSFPKGESVGDYVKTEYPVAVNYTERNSDDRIKLLKSFFGENVPEDMAPMLEKMLSDLNANRGKGFVNEEDDTIALLTGNAGAQKIWVLTDEGCASSGDAFVETMSFSPLVTVVGRPTSGITDYSNLNMVTFDDFQLRYPTSRDSRIDHGKGLLHRGVPVDVYIPWAPEHIKKDAMLEYVLDEIGKN